MAVPVPLTGPLALLKVRRGEGNEELVGAIQNFAVTETINRETLFCIGNLFPWSSPPVSASGTIDCSGIALSYRADLLPYAVARNVIDKEDYSNRLQFDNQGMTVTLYKKAPILSPSIEDGINSMHQTKGVFGGVDTNSIKNGSVHSAMTANLIPFAKITRVFIVSSGFEVGENKVASQQSSFIFLDPIKYDVSEPYTTLNLSSSISEQENSRAKIGRTASDIVGI
jgi:hypothetical protein